MLEKKEKERYNRHLLLDKVGMEGQLKLKAAKVLVIGAGGLGCPILQYLTAAGVGNIGVIDFDTVDISNLQRQILFTENDLGKNKAEVAVKRLSQLNGMVSFDVFTDRLTTNNAIELFEMYDIVIDGTDNFSTRYLVNDASVLTNTPLVYGSIYLFEGQVSVFNYKGGPSYRCLFPTPPKHGSVKNCNEIGVIGVLPGVIGTQQANEAIKIILEIGEPLNGKLMLYDALKASYITISVEKSEEQIDKVLANKAKFESFDYDLFCGVEKDVSYSSDEISLEELDTYKNNAKVQLIDLREEWEEPVFEAENKIRITMSDLIEKIKDIKKEGKVILLCQTGARSFQVKTLLEKQFGFSNLIVLKEGLEKYGE